MLTQERQLLGSMLPCPFCGGAAGLSSGECGINGMPAHHRAAQCTECGAGLGYLPMRSAVAAWNQRVQNASTATANALRDYFAAKALQALITSNDDGAGDRINDIPGYAYDIADAMIRARQEFRHGID